jgi:predicted nucleic acid-binding protein
MIVDTTYVLDLIRGDADAFRKGQELAAADTPLKIPTMTMMELFVGYGATGDEEEARRVENALLGHPIIDMDQVIARRAGWIGGRTGLDPGDSIIGATAAVHGEPVLTRNVDDFEQIEGVAVETY